MKTKKTKQKKEKSNTKKELSEFTENEIDEIKTIAENKSILDDSVEDTEDLIKKINISISGSEIDLAKMVIQCHDILLTNSFKFKEDKKNFINKIEEYLKKLDLSELRIIISDYGEGNSYGSYNIGEKIKRNVNSNRESYMKLIKFFLRIFSEED